MASKNENQTQDDAKNAYCQQFLWEKGSLRIMYATWTAMNMSYGLNADEVLVWAEYCALLSRALVNISIALGEDIEAFDDISFDGEVPMW